jgi:hypothetical protein
VLVEIYRSFQTESRSGAEVASSGN